MSMHKISLSHLARLAALGLLLSASLAVQAEGVHVPPLLLEEGGNLETFDPIALRIRIQKGRSYRIDPAGTLVTVVSGQGIHTQLAGRFPDLAERLARFKARPISFQSTPDGQLKQLVLDERYLSRQ